MTNQEYMFESNMGRVQFQKDSIKEEEDKIEKLLKIQEELTAKERTYQFYRPLNELWKAYMNDLIKNEKGEDELVTPPLNGTILPGVTRDSILTLTKEMK